MVRVLHVLGGLGTGGTESLIMNWYRNIDRTKIQFDFLVRSSDDNYTDEIQRMGGRIFYTSSFPRHLVRNYIETKNILKKKEWNVIHVHGNAAIYILPLKIAKKYGYECRIMHSHNVKTQKNVFKAVHLWNRKKMLKYATHRLACSRAAGEWMFADEEFQIIRNAIDTKAYSFDRKAREELRKKYGLEEKYVVGHVGRFALQKNHIFLLDVFEAIVSKKQESVLILVGDGELEQEARDKAKRLGISDRVIFLGRRSDVGKIMSAMDVFVLPSLYEGLGNVLVEAQVNGLSCVVSEEAFNEEVQIFNGLQRISLRENAEEWADCVLGEENTIAKRTLSDEMLAATGYDIKIEISYLEKLYLQEERNRR